nr:alkaline phosphatase [Clostridia bacterium]
YETVAFSDAVQVAIDFAQAHPEETLIIVTGDHETGGLTIGFAATAYNTYFGYLQSQDMSFTDFDAVIAGLREEQASFDKTLEAIEAHYGLTSAPDQALTLTETELASLEKAYTLSMQAKADRVLGEAEALAYGGYEPLSMAVSHILNNKAGIAYTSYAHTGLQLPVYAMGVGAENFAGSYDNTDIFAKTMNAMGLGR